MLRNNCKISLDNFIQESLFHKQRGYYMKKNPIGKNGDFITSPNISIIFSEMIALWIFSFWKKLNYPKKINIIEMGGGNGEMIFQIIKTLKKFDLFTNCSNFMILDKSPSLIQLQKNKLKGFKVSWKKNLKNIPEFPTIFIANEFFDAFPVKQFFKNNNVWYEKYIDKKGENFTFCKKKVEKKYIEKLIEEKIKKTDFFIEFSPQGLNSLKEISKIIKKQNGGLLIIDYGYNKNKMFDSLQGLKKHKKANILENLYDCDITHLLNFPFYKKKLKKYKLDSIKFTSQREFLFKMGIIERANIISKNLSLASKMDIYYRIKRLTDKNQMGSLFKVLFATKKYNKFNLGF